MALSRTSTDLQTVQALLRERRLDRTLTSGHLPAPDRVAPFDRAAVDRALGGGVARGHLSEIVGPVSSGRTSLAWAALAAASRRGEWVALVDTFDRFDPETAAACGIELPRLLWVRGQAMSRTAAAVDPAWIPGQRAVSGPGTLLERTVDRALKSLNLIVQSGVCTLVVLDLVDVPPASLARLPPATWLRIQRVVEGSETAVVLLASAPVARSAGGMSIRTGGGRAIAPGAEARAGVRVHVGGRSSIGGAPGPCPPAASPREGAISRQVCWKGTHDRSRRLGGLRSNVRATSPRGHAGALTLAFGQ